MELIREYSPIALIASHVSAATTTTRVNSGLLVSACYLSAATLDTLFESTLFEDSTE